MSRLEAIVGGARMHASRNDKATNGTTLQKMSKMRGSMTSVLSVSPWSRSSTSVIRRYTARQLGRLGNASPGASCVTRHRCRPGGPECTQMCGHLRSL